jgi:hypothetical protein
MMNTIEEQGVATNAQMVAMVVSGNGTSYEASRAKAVAYRMPVYLCAVVDSMAANGKKSRNAMLNLLVSAGIDAVRSQLKDDVIETLQIGEAEAMARIMNETTESLEE